MKLLSLIKNKIVVFVAILFVSGMIILPDVTADGFRNAINIWLNSIVPVLLPFFIFSDFIKRTGELEYLPPRVYPFIISFLSGYPMGAKVTADFIKENRLSLPEGKRVLSYSLVTGPSFIIFTIGSFIGSTKAAVIVAISHYLGALLNSFFYYNSHKSVANYYLEKHNTENITMEKFTQAINEGFKAMGTILAYLMIFTIAIFFIEHIGLFDYVKNQTLLSFIKGIFEMTIGINLIGMCDISIRLKTIISAFLVSLGGLSVIGQATSIAGGCGLKLIDIVEVKITHGLLAGIIATLLVNIMLI